ncbi:hypothetical protein GGI25_000162 [Coemansia spiralis]|uniref:Uncharacterized protein n=2 Tax=Coemansia TaxID=4863 RepID=A0A9W8L1H0_9FUNG|nr:hypothetical protein EDC05_002806 [Coemansia umbellata]KAJ2621820.1 hypothetical protein GGI26_003800 [Coemansia sp. RSA 1358]KAJ2681207.1 hypothetical protein GGI25_000162 [Coemansia spiralis]
MVSASNDSGTSPYTLFIEKWWQMHDKYVSLWSPEKGAFDQNFALSLTKQYDQVVESANKDTGKAIENIVESTKANTAPALPLQIAHAMDDAWKKEGSNYMSIDSRSNSKDSWAAFTPAPDFKFSF